MLVYYLINNINLFYLMFGIYLVKRIIFFLDFGNIVMYCRILLI